MENYVPRSLMSLGLHCLPFHFKMARKKPTKTMNFFCLWLLKRRKALGIEGTFCACENLDSHAHIRMKNTQKLQTCSQYQMNYICGETHNLRWHDREDLDNCAPIFSGITTLMSCNNMCLGAFARYLDSSQDEVNFCSSQEEHG